MDNITLERFGQGKPNLPEPFLASLESNQVSDTNPTTEFDATRSAGLGEVTRTEQEMARTGPSKMITLGFVPIGILLAGFFLVSLIVMVLYSFWQTEGFNVAPKSLGVTMLGLIVGYLFAYFLVRHVGITFIHVIRDKKKACPCRTESLSYPTASPRR